MFLNYSFVIWPFIHQLTVQKQTGDVGLEGGTTYTRPTSIPDVCADLFFFTTEITFYVITERLKHRIPGTSVDSNVNDTQRYDLDEMSCNKCERIAFASFQIEKKQT